MMEQYCIMCVEYLDTTIPHTSHQRWVYRTSLSEPWVMLFCAPPVDGSCGTEWMSCSQSILLNWEQIYNSLNVLFMLYVVWKDAWVFCNLCVLTSGRVSRCSSRCVSESADCGSINKSHQRDRSFLVKRRSWRTLVIIIINETEGKMIFFHDKSRISNSDMLHYYTAAFNQWKHFTMGRR